MAGHDVGQVFYSEQHGGQYGGEEGGPGGVRVHASRKFADFLRNFRGEPSAGQPDGTTLYRDALDAEPPPPTLRVLLDDLIAHDAQLADALRRNPGEYLPLLEQAAGDVLLSLRNAPAAGEDEPSRPPVQVFLSSSETPRPIRTLASADVSRLVVVPGIVIGASRCKPKAVVVAVQCRACKGTKLLACGQGFGGAQIPVSCDLAPPGSDKCGLDPFSILPDKCVYTDQQTLKLQELPEAVPAGELPRSLLLLVDRHAAQTVVPGARVRVAGVFSVQAGVGGGGGGGSGDAGGGKRGRGGGDRNRAAVAIRLPYLRVVGMEPQGEAARGAAAAFSDEEQRAFRAFASRSPAEVLARIRDLVAPSIFGHADIKAAIACLLFGGSRKRLADGARLRGDVNVLLLGDPSTAKSQFLKFVEKTAPIAVYTSGKGSSAAGLTASVIKDPSSGEFYLEGGAMVLADGGVVCIDEFDKMRPDDRVAIHEAMEQQTISIAKAGITTVLNSRTAVLAAANPPSGRYDDLKTAQENIELQTTILSRFDLIFIVRDERNYAKDLAIAAYVVNVHRNAAAAPPAEGRPQDGPAGDRARQEAFLKRYCQYARLACRPRLSEGGARALESEYVRIRAEMRDRSRATGGAPAVPITVRQLEAVVRLSESLAKMCLQPVATEAHVREALRLFTVSTVEAAKSGLAEAVSLTPEQRGELHAVEERVRQRLPLGATALRRHLVEELVRYGLSEWAVDRALLAMSQRGEVEYRNEGRRVMRKQTT